MAMASTGGGGGVIPGRRRIGRVSAGLRFVWMFSQIGARIRLDTDVGFGDLKRGISDIYAIGPAP